MKYTILAILISAFFNTSTTAIIQWEQPPDVHQTCIHRYYVGGDEPSAFCMHDLPAGTTSIELPGIYDRRWYAPTYGDVYVLSFEGVDVGRAVLGEAEIHRLYMSLVMQSAVPLERRVYLALIE